MLNRQCTLFFGQEYFTEMIKMYYECIGSETFVIYVRMALLRGRS